MATLKICKLHFTSPMHISDQKNNDYGTSLKTISSDTIYAAVIAVLAKMGVAIPENGDLGFVVSSLFPYYQHCDDSDPVFFFPQPLQTRMIQLSEKSQGERKKVKKVKWLDLKYFEKVLQGIHLFEKEDDDIMNIHGDYLSKEKVPSDFICSQVIQRVSIESRDRKEEALPYYVDRVSFRDSSGLFFIVQGDTSLLEKALSLLGTEGIGSARSVGNGLFEHEFSTIDIHLPDEAEHGVSLSLLIPESKEQFMSLSNTDRLAYEIERHGGWITTHPFEGIRKNIIYGFTAGSVFSFKSQGVNTIGRIVNLHPDVDFLEEELHPIWRSGKSIILPIIV